MEALAGALVDPALQHRHLLQQHRAGLVAVAGGAARLEVHRQHADRRAARRAHDQVHARAQVGVADLQRGDVRQALVGHALADREAGALRVHGQPGTAAAFALAPGADARLDLHGVARRVEHAFRRGLRFHFLERHHVRAERIDVGAHRGVIGLGARAAAGAVVLGQVLHVPARQGQRGRGGPAFAHAGAGRGEEQAEGGEQGMACHARK